MGKRSKRQRVAREGKEDAHTVKTRSERQLQRLRKLVVGGRINHNHRTEPGSQRAQDNYFSSVLRSSSALGWALSAFQRWSWLASDEILGDSILEELLSYFVQGGHEDVHAAYENAKAHARGVLFDCAVRNEFLFKKGLLADDNLEHAALRRKLIENPLALLSDQSVLDYLARELLSRGSRFLSELARDFQNRERRAAVPATDMNLLVLAQHWTDSHCPLWLMTRPALLKACQGLSEKGSWTQSMVDDRLKESKLPRFKEKPIVDIELNESHDITSFVISRKAFVNLTRVVFGQPFEHHLAPDREAYLKGDIIKTINRSWEQIHADRVVFLASEIMALKKRTIGYKLVARRPIYRVQ